MREFTLEHYMTLAPAEIPGRWQCHNLERALTEAWHVFSSRGEDALIAVTLGNRVIYDKPALVGLMNQFSQASAHGTSVNQTAARIAQGRVIDEETFQSICSEVTDSLASTINRSDLALRDKRLAAVGELLRYSRLYLGITEPGGGVVPSGGSNFYSRYNAIASLVDQRASPYFNPIPHLEKYMEGIFGAEPWADETADD